MGGTPRHDAAWSEFMNNLLSYAQGAPQELQAPIIEAGSRWTPGGYGQGNLSRLKSDITQIGVLARPLLSDTGGGGGGANWSPGILADPPTHPHQKIFPQEKNEIYQRGPNLEVDFRYTNFFLASDPPTHPPPGIVSTSH